MSQYREIKARYPDGILFFQVGDFYETFYDDAKEVSRLLNIALTSRDKGKRDPVPLAGVPLHAAEAYISKLLKAGRKVVVCDQVEPAADAKGIVKRAVTDVITPGTTIAPSTLIEEENNYVASFLIEDEMCGFSLLDLSTGDFKAGQAPVPEIEALLAGYRIREAIIPEESPSLASLIKDLNPLCAIEELPAFDFGESSGYEILQSHFNVNDLTCFGIEEQPLATAASGAMLKYVKDLRQNELKHITGIRFLISHKALFLDNETLRNLEIFEPLRGNSPETTLINYLDKTQSACGARELRAWLLRPLRDASSINGRLDAVGALASDQIELRDLRRKLHRFPDVERILSRISALKAGPRELRALLDALERAPEIAETGRRMSSALIQDCAAELEQEVAARDLIERAIEPACPANLKDGGVIRRGYSSELDKLIDDSESGKKWIASLQQSERERTGIPSLKVGFNKVFGYYIDVSRIHDDKVPEDYICKQTLVASQRYVTSELKEREHAILSAESRRIDLEKEIFAGLCEGISSESAKLQEMAHAAAVLDVISTFAHIAVDRDYCRPEVNNSADLQITGGRHPVVELLSDSSFIPNDVHLRPEDTQFLIITGPNMGGKSTFIRQTALISILAHAGCFVPASRAVVGLMDRIFTRVGSSDNVAKGQSTFLVEMSETAKILHNCTSRSLVLLDEVGRGTSTLDGLSLAWAVTEYLLEDPDIRPKTLFATHYHELTHLSEKHGRIQNMRVDVKEWGKEIVFLYKIKPGASDKSYGIHVARLAGLPDGVIVRAAQILDLLEKGESFAIPRAADPPRQTRLFEDTDLLRDRLKSLDINEITPVEALQILADLRRLAE
jgi:DNA mismatch repair protein MutS